MADLNESQQPQLRRETIAVTVLAAVFVILRFISRFKKGLNFGIDDYTIVLALVGGSRLVEKSFFQTRLTTFNRCFSSPMRVSTWPVGQSIYLQAERAFD